MAAVLEQFKLLLGIPEWFLLSKEEISSFDYYLTETENDLSRALWSLKLDCGAWDAFFAT